MSPPLSGPAGNRRIIPIKADIGSAQVEAVALTRRDALKLLAASMAVAAGGCAKPPEEAVQTYMSGPEHTPGEAAVYYASAHVREGYAHGVLVGTQDGRPIKVEGNPRHPASLGASDVFSQASVLSLWDTDRSKAVARRIDGPEPTEPLPSEPSMGIASWADFERAWVPMRAALQARRGEGLVVLTGPFSSPTLLEQMQGLQADLPEMKWAGQAAWVDDHVLEGAKLAFGRALQPLYRLDQATVVLSLGEDAFSGGPGSLRHAQDWARRRNAPEAPPLLFVAETAPSLMGARADRRLALHPADLEALVWRLVARLSTSSPPSAAPSASSPALLSFEDEVLGRLMAAGAHALVLAGPALSPQAHAAVHWLNRSLGAQGNTIDWIEPVLARPPQGLLELAEDLAAGKVQSLWMLGCNPVYELGLGQAFARALRRVPFSVHLGQHLDETAAHCAWHLPESHDFEQWSDARAFDGTVTLLQPAMAPLYDTRSSHEVLALLAGSGSRKGRDIVRAYWRSHAAHSTEASQTSDKAFEAFWRQALTDGRIEDSQHAPVPSLPPGRLPSWPDRQVPGPGEVYLHIAPDPAVRNGVYANNAWLQEWPRPLTQLTWGNALYLGPGTARAMKLETGDIAEVKSAQGVRLHCPVRVWQGHAEGAATLHAGYGRWRAGRIGSGLGVNANLLRTTAPGHVVASVSKTGQQHSFAVRQMEMSQHGRDLARVVRPGQRASTEPHLPSLYPDHPNPVHAWAMVVDLDACIGCGACTVACQAENNIPTVGPEEVAKGRIMHWLRVDAYPQPSGQALFQPVPCMHCENAPCEVVCPVGATVHDSEGLNAQVYNRCIGTRFCSNNCPYKVRRFNFLQYSDLNTESLHGLRNPDVTVRERGVMEKCTYCVQRISRARRHAERTGEPLRDGDVVTACQAVCPTRAITFGDLNQAGSEVNQARRSERHYALLGELNTRPRTTYLARRASPLDDAA